MTVLGAREWKVIAFIDLQKQQWSTKYTSRLTDCTIGWVGRSSHNKSRGSSEGEEKQNLGQEVHDFGQLCFCELRNTLK